MELDTSSSIKKQKGGGEGKFIWIPPLKSWIFITLHRQIKATLGTSNKNFFHINSYLHFTFLPLSFSNEKISINLVQLLFPNCFSFSSIVDVHTLTIACWLKKRSTKVHRDLSFGIFGKIPDTLVYAIYYSCT